MATLSELSNDYMDAAVRLRAALDEVRAAMEAKAAREAAAQKEGE